jgi:Na+-transporting methylmalonyl-CoA/oxaloacetate decarboxylase gamma subunit
MNGTPVPDDFEMTDDSPFIRESAEREATSGTRRSSRGLSVICVMAIVLSVLGLLMSCVALTSQILSSRVKQAIAQMPGPANPSANKAQREFNDRMMATADRYKWMTLPLTLAKLIVEAVLLAGAILTMRLNRRGRSWLLAGLVAAIVVESLYAVPTIIVQRESQAAMSDLMSQSVASQRGTNSPPPGMDNFAAAFGSAIGILSMLIAVVWLVAKIVFYAIGIRYLLKPELISLFAPPTADAPARPV